VLGLAKKDKVDASASASASAAAAVVSTSSTKKTTTTATTRVTELVEGEMLMINVGSTSTGARVERVKAGAKLAQLGLTTPVCADVGEKLAISRRIDKRWRLIGWGTIVRGTSTTKHQVA
jgi:translation initiation factor 2 gamma subunit (eIF-2gamma)